MLVQDKEPVTLENVQHISQMHHVSWTQGGQKRTTPYRVRISSVKVWKRKNKAEICYRWGYKDWYYISGTKEDVDFELRRNWRTGSGQ